MMFGSKVSLDFFHRSLHTSTAVARNPCVSWAFLLFLSYLSLISIVRPALARHVYSP